MMMVNTAANVRGADSAQVLCRRFSRLVGYQEVNAQSGPLAQMGKLRHGSGAFTAQTPEERWWEVLRRGAEGRGPDPRPWFPPGQQGELGQASTSLSLAGNGAMTVLRGRGSVPSPLRPQQTV